MSSSNSNGAHNYLLHAEDVAASISSTRILKGLTFGVRNGTLVGLLGPNGSGKTTLMRCVGGVLPYEGRLTFDGRPIASWNPAGLAQRMAFVRQAVSLTFDFTVAELVLLGRSPHKRWLQDYSRGDELRMETALQQVDLAGFRERSVLTLSGGELQRALLAQALVQEAELLLLDEPTSHLDVHYQYEFMEMVHRLVQNGRTAVAVFHDLEMAARYADHVLVLQGGRLVAAGAPHTVVTEDLIERVFRMQAALHTSSDGHLRIEYLRPIRKPSTEHHEDLHANR